MNKKIKFYKMQACGNDFILILHQDFPLSINAMPAFAKKFCDRHFGIGADGVIFLAAPFSEANLLNLPEIYQIPDYSWHFYNSDGSRAGMCGNGARCAAWLAVKMELAKKEHSFYTDVGLIRASVNLKENTVKILLTEYTDQKTNLLCEIDNEKYNIHFVNTGVPHAVFVVDDINSISIDDLGSKIRHHSIFGKEGANVNFVQIVDDKNLLIRTYERGLEKESFACGTGAAAAAIITNSLGKTKNEVSLKTIKNEFLFVQIKGDQVFLEGSVRFVFEGSIEKAYLF